MTEHEEAIQLANRVLDRTGSADPDDDLAILARQLLRTKERADRFEKLANDFLDKTADGVFICECETLYCPHCNGEVNIVVDHAYCWNCPNPDCEGDVPLPLFMDHCLAKPKETK